MVKTVINKKNIVIVPVEGALTTWMGPSLPRARCLGAGGRAVLPDPRLVQAPGPQQADGQILHRILNTVINGQSPHCAMLPC